MSDWINSKRMTRIFTLSIFLLFTAILYAQTETRSLNVHYINEQIEIDGIMDEPVWETADVADNFWQFFPADSVRAKLPTEVRILYDDHAIYVGIYAVIAGEVVVANLRRDFTGTANDNIALMFDTYSDGTNAFVFSVTPYGVQRDVQVSGGGASRSGFNVYWDAKWKAESKMHNDHYVIEMAIPLTSLKFREGVDTWRFRAYRWDLRTNEQSTWVRVPQNQLMANLAFMGNLVFEKPLSKSRTPLTFIPYVNALADRDYETDPSEIRLRAGGDAKVAIGNNLNLDLTLLPDFSNVEVDNIYTNLTRFEIFLPERRQFFIDNSDLFGNFGSSGDATPFFSRRIGLARDTVGNLIENRIIGGARLSGKLNDNWRLGFLNIQTDEDPDNKVPSYNNMMFALQKRVFSRSNIGFFAVNRQSFKDYEFLDRKEGYSRVAGVDYNLESANGVWSGKFFLHKSFQPDDNNGNLAAKAYLLFNKRKLNLSADFVYVDEEFRSDLGFIPRRGTFKFAPSAATIFYPKKGIVNTSRLQLSSLMYYNPDQKFKRTDHEIGITWTSAFKNMSTFEFQYSNNFIFLTYDFDPTRTPNGIPLPGDTGYFFNQISAQYISSATKLFTFTGESAIGQFYSGSRFSIGGQLAYRFQPWVSLSIDLNYDQIRLPDPHPDADYWLVTPRVDVTFSKSLFWSTLIQYSNQRENLGINSRVQWRFAPLSDLYIVYNDNYFTGDFGPRFRSINLKLTYWLNV